MTVKNAFGSGYSGGNGSVGFYPTDIQSEAKWHKVQVKVNPPTFVMFSNKVRKLHFSFERFIENRIRERFPFPGTPIIIRQRAKARTDKAS